MDSRSCAELTFRFDDGSGHTLGVSPTNALVYYFRGEVDNVYVKAACATYCQAIDRAYEAYKAHAMGVLV